MSLHAIKQAVEVQEYHNVKRALEKDKLKTPIAVKIVGTPAGLSYPRKLPWSSISSLMRAEERIA